MAALIRFMVSSIRAFLDTSSPRPSAILVMMDGSSGMPPASMAAISCLARRISGAMSSAGFSRFRTRRIRDFIAYWFWASEWMVQKLSMSPSASSASLIDWKTPSSFASSS